MCVKSQLMARADAIFGHGRDGIMIFASYADESCDRKKKELVCAGSFFGWPVNYVDAANKWQDRLKADGLDYFHSVECEMLIGQFDYAKRNTSINEERARADSLRHDLIEIVRKAQGVAAVAVGVVLPDYYDLIGNSPKAAHYFGSEPITYAYRKLIKQTIYLIHNDWPEARGIPIAFTFDVRSHWQQAEQEYEKLRTDDLLCASRMGFVGHDDDRKVIPLQMADLAAYEGRHRLISFFEGGKNRLWWDQLIRDHMFYYLGYADREQMEGELSELPDIEC